MHRPYQTIPISVAILTVSDTRTFENDGSGQTIQSLLQLHNLNIVKYTIVKDEMMDITTTVQKWCDNRDINTIIITGGTGFAPRDITYEAVSPLLEKEMQGFGELFRSLSFAEIGPHAIFSRAVAGSRNETAIYVVPGSINAVKLAINKLILPTVHHFIEELNRS